MEYIRRFAVLIGIVSLGVFSICTSIAQTSGDATGFLQAPGITSGTVVDDTYFTGTIDAGVDFRKSSALAIDISPEFSIDGGSDWQQASFSPYAKKTYPNRDGSNSVTVKRIAEGYIVIWAARSDTQSFLRGQRYDQNGNELGPAFTIASAVASLGRPEVTSLENGNHVITWTEYAPVPSNHGKVVNSSWATVGTLTFPLIDPDITSAQYLPRPVTFDDGSFGVAWWESSPTNLIFFPNKVVYRHYDAGGNPISPAKSLGSLMLKTDVDWRVSSYRNKLILAQSSGTYMSTVPAQLTLGVFSADGSSLDATSLGAARKPRLIKKSDGKPALIYVGTGSAIIYQDLYPALDTGIVTMGTAVQVATPSSGVVNLVGASLDEGRTAIFWNEPWVENGQSDLQIRGGIVSQNSVERTFSLFRGLGLRAGSGGTSTVITGVNTSGDSYGAVFFSPVVHLQTGSISPQHDINLMFRATDPVEGVISSGIRSYRYADPADGEGVSINYPAGYVAEDTLSVSVSPNCVTCTALQLYDRVAPLQNDSCGEFSEWRTYGNNSIFNTDNLVAVNSGACYQYKASVTNVLGNTYETVPTGMAKVDTAEPSIQVLDETKQWDQVTLDVSTSDPETGVVSRTYQVNSDQPVNFEGSRFTTTLVDGLNKITVRATDAAGNSTSFDHFVSVDLSQPSIDIYGIEEGGIYGTDVAYTYASNQPLTDVTVLVDGAPRADLAGLSDGQHTLTISGYDERGQQVSSSVSFSIDSNLFSLTVQSPQAREYSSGQIGLLYQTSQPASRVWYRLNGGPEQSGTEIGPLNDGLYHIEVSAQAADGRIATRFVDFSVLKARPTLSVISPEPAHIYGSKNLQVNFVSDSPVTYWLDGTGEGEIKPGDSVSVSEDGHHTLSLTAVQPQSGLTVTRTIEFDIDSVEPTLDLLSPKPILYSFTDVPVQFQGNKQFANVIYTLDGDPVQTLTGLAAGSHTFTIQATDAAGRSVQKQVQFEVANLTIVSPGQNEEVVSNTMPPSATLVYDASGNIDTVSMALDGGVGQLLTSPPGTSIPVVASPGEHDLLLAGAYHGQKIAKRRVFTLGSKNIKVGPGSIDYRYSGCNQDLADCQVTATITLTNDGHYDISQPFRVRFDHIAPNGYESQWVDVPGLGGGQSRSYSLAPFTAAAGDTLMVSVDPYGDIPGEWTIDNTHSITFDAGSIESIATTLPNDALFAGVSLLDSVTVATSGPVQSVEANVGGWKFIDRTPNDGFHLMLDRGLLTPEDSCIAYVARNQAGIAVDVSNVCYRVKRLTTTDATPMQVNWDAFAVAGRTVDLNSIDLAAFNRHVGDVWLRTMSKRNAIFARAENSRIVYQIISDQSRSERLYNDYVRFSNAPFVGAGQLPKPDAIVVSTLSAGDGTCDVDGVLVGTARYTSQDLADVYAEEIAAANAELDAQQAELQKYVAVLESVESILDRMERYTLGTIDLDVDIPADLIDVGVTGNYDQWSRSVGCAVVEPGLQEVSFALQADYGLNLDASVNGHVKGASLDLTLTPLFGLDVDFQLYPLDLRVPVTSSLNVHLAQFNDQFLAGPIHANFATSVSVDQTVADAEIDIDPLAWLAEDFARLGGADARLRVYADGVAKLAWHAGKEGDSPPIPFWSLFQNLAEGAAVDTGSLGEEMTYHSYQFHRFSGKVWLQTRWKICAGFLGCYKSGWKTQKTYFNQTTGPVGTDFNPGLVSLAYSSMKPAVAFNIDDAATLAAYALLTNNDQIAEAVACGAFEGALLDMSNTPIYSNQSGQCLPLADPDYVPEGGGTFYADASCSVELPYTPTPFLSYCRNNLLSPTNQTYIGNAAAWENTGDPRYAVLGKNRRWTLSHGARLDISALSQAGNHRPFVKQVEYRNVDGCHLEMRVYKRDILEEGLKPLMLIHGGAWKYRGMGAIGMEPLVSHLTEKGYVVFAPYYRLMGTSDGPSECQIPASSGQVPGEAITADINAALDWVEQNGVFLGAQPNAKVAVAGQSAGAHLSAWLATHRGDEVSQALLFYPPTDMEYFIEQSQAVDGLYRDNSDAQALVAQFMGVPDIGSLDLNNLPAVVTDNSFPPAIKAGATVPPMYLIHGNADTLVPVEMSTRMCDALGGVLFGTTPTAGGAYSCGSRNGIESQVHVIDGANHMLDLKCFADPASTVIGALADSNGVPVCTSGSLTGEYYVREAMKGALNWLQ